MHIVFFDEVGRCLRFIYSNKLSPLSEMLIEVQKVAPNDNPFEPETILVQSQGMAQWFKCEWRMLLALLASLISLSLPVFMATISPIISAFA